MNAKRCRMTHIVCLAVFVLAGWATAGFCAQDELSDGQLLYVPAYSHIYSGNREQPYLLTVTLSIRNTNLDRSITITRVDYYETKGGLLKSYIDKPVTLKPLESNRFIVPQKESKGGSGANFLVTWTAETKVNTPIVEAIMIGTQSQQGISFTSRGRAVRPIGKK